MVLKKPDIWDKKRGPINQGEDTGGQLASNDTINQTRELASEPTSTHNGLSVSINASNDASKHASTQASTNSSKLASEEDSAPASKQESNLEESSFLLKKQKRVKQEQLSVRINELVWEWLDKTYRASGRGKNELVERALVRFLPEKLMPKELKNSLPPDYFDGVK